MSPHPYCASHPDGPRSRAVFSIASAILFRPGHAATRQQGRQAACVRRRHGRTLEEPVSETARVLGERLLDDTVGIPVGVLIDGRIAARSDHINVGACARVRRPRQIEPGRTDGKTVLVVCRGVDRGIELDDDVRWTGLGQTDERAARTPPASWDLRRRTQKRRTLLPSQTRQRCRSPLVRT